LVILPAPLNEVQNEARQSRRAARYISRRFLHFNSSLPRLRFCGVDPVASVGVKGSRGVLDPMTGRFVKNPKVSAGSVTVKATGSGVNRRAGFGQLQLCGSVWACPVCSAKINTVRASDIAAAISAWHAPVFGPQPSPASKTGAGFLHRGGRIVLVTLTMRHKKGQELDDLWTRGVSAGWHAVTSGRSWNDDQTDYGSWVSRVVKTGKRAGETVWGHRIGYSRVVETTYGVNGWHVHIHALLFVRQDITGPEATALGHSIFSRWSASLVAEGFGAPTLTNGVDIKLLGPEARDAKAIAEYFAKNTFAGSKRASNVAFEVSGGLGKWARGSNRTPFQILENLCSGEDYAGFEDDLARWWVWESASKGKRQLTWSPWLRSYLRLNEELTDEEIAASELGGEIVLELRPDQFDAVVSVGAHELLNAVESDDDMTAAYLWLDSNLGRWRTRMDYGLSESGDWVAVSSVERVEL
jgi:hypothetical protein